MPGWAFSVLIEAFAGLILAALVFEFVGERRVARDQPATADGDRSIDPAPPAA
jgi:hypothetical protein